MPANPAYCRLMLIRIGEMVDGLADVQALDDPIKSTYQILSTFRYPISERLKIDEYYNDMKTMLGDQWSLKLSVEPGGSELTIAKLSARIKYEDEKSL